MGMERKKKKEKDLWSFKWAKYLLGEVEERMRSIRERLRSRFEHVMKPSWNPETCCLEPLIETYESDKEFIINVDLPCVKKEDIEVHIENKDLEISAKCAHVIKFEKWGTIQRKTDFHSFRSRIHLPLYVDEKRAKASFKVGILQIKIPKEEKTKIKIE